MKRVAEHKAIVGIPLVVRIRVVRVQPALVAIMLHIEDIRVAVRIGYVRDTIRTTTL